MSEDDTTSKPTVGFSSLERLPVGLMPDELCSKADRQGEGNDRPVGLSPI